MQSSSAAILEPKKIKSVTMSIVSLSICHEVMGLNVVILVLWMLSFKSAFFSLITLEVFIIIWVLEKILESPLNCKEIKPVNPKGNQTWIFIGRIDAETEAPILWPPNVKSWFIGKDPDTGKDWGQEEKGATENEMVGWHQFNGDELGWTPRDGEEQGGLVFCRPSSHKESDTI